MKNFVYLKILLILLAVSPLKAQDEVDRVLESSIEDANILIEGYISPLMNTLGTGLASGWYNTAQPHETLGFDLTFTLNAVRVPDSDLLYGVSNLNNTTLISGGNEAPTIFGPDQAPRYTYDYIDPESGEDRQGEFEGPPGVALENEIGMQAVPVPMLHLGIGTFKNTDIKIRWTPTINVNDDAELKLIGVGIMHDIKQYLPGVKYIPIDLSAFVGYTRMNTNIFIEEGGSSGVTTDNGQLAVEFNSLTVQGLVSKQISVLTFYGGIGYNRITSSLVLEGDYQVRDESGTVDNIYTNPIDLDFGTSGPRVTAGFRLKLTILSLHVDYTLQKYSTLSFGAGISVR